MKQSMNFVPLRLAVAMTLVLMTALANANATTGILFAAADDQKIDPIVTGASTSAKELEEWKAAKKRFEECGLCGELQEFPGDLPE